MEIKIRKWSHAEKYEIEIREVNPDELKAMGLKEALQLNNGAAVTMEVKRVIFKG